VIISEDPDVAYPDVAYPDVGIAYPDVGVAYHDIVVAYPDDYHYLNFLIIVEIPLYY